MKKIRCAIYTRKSSEEGLEQEFNSLHAQREACEAYIKSQKHEGWELLPKPYDDGGFSGGTMERPALRQLMADIENDLVDVIVVYKVDRLTRSLTDFARLMEIMDKQGISFVSITQQFNTTTSMGRLTLNVLLSFAQFEREVTGERIRDKIALSKQKGKWMGGITPLGYDAIEQKLVINEKEAQTVRHIFDRYLALQSVNLLKADLDADGYRTKFRTHKNGKTAGGLSFSKGHLYHMLQNRTYVGDIVHKEKSYPGEHQAIISEETFENARAVIRANRIKKMSAAGTKDPCLLAGKLFDDCGNCMTPKHSNTRRRHYRYYTSQAIIQGRAYEAGSLPNIPAHEIEQLVRAEIADFLKDTKQLQQYLQNETVDQQKALIKIANGMTHRNMEEERLFLRSIINRIILSSTQMKIDLCGNRLIQALQGNVFEEKLETMETPITLTRHVQLAAVSKGGKVIIGNIISSCNLQLVKAIVRSFLWNEQLLTGEKANVKEIADHENIASATYVSRIIRLRFLASDIIESILNGTQPVNWTVEKLFTIRSLDWNEQRQILGIA